MFWYDLKVEKEGHQANSLTFLAAVWDTGQRWAASRWSRPRWGWPCHRIWRLGPSPLTSGLERWTSGYRAAAWECQWKINGCFVIEKCLICLTHQVPTLYSDFIPNDVSLGWFIKLHCNWMNVKISLQISLNRSFNHDFSCHNPSQMNDTIVTMPISVIGM